MKKVQIFIKKFLSLSYSLPFSNSHSLSFDWVYCSLHARKCQVKVKSFWLIKLLTNGSSWSKRYKSCAFLCRRFFKPRVGSDQKKRLLSIFSTEQAIFSFLSYCSFELLQTRVSFLVFPSSNYWNFYRKTMCKVIFKLLFQAFSKNS